MNQLLIYQFPSLYNKAGVEVAVATQRCGQTSKEVILWLKSQQILGRSPGRRKLVEEVMFIWSQLLLRNKLIKEYTSGYETVNRVTCTVERREWNAAPSDLRVFTLERFTFWKHLIRSETHVFKHEHSSQWQPRNTLWNKDSPARRTTAASLNTSYKIAGNGAH